jgi:uncharacterized membrane protein YhaH (DUF805 family)
MWKKLDPRGRSEAGEFLKLEVVCLAAALPLVCLILLDGPKSDVSEAGFFGLWVNLAVLSLGAIRRMHDSGDSAVWLWFVLGGPILALAGWQIAAPDFLWVLIVVAGLWTLAGHYSLYLSEPDGDNRWGPGPAWKNRKLKGRLESIDDEDG